MIKIAFMGTPEFAVPSLAALYDAGYELCVLHSRISPPDAADGLLRRRLRFCIGEGDTRVSTSTCAAAGGRGNT